MSTVADTAEPSASALIAPAFAQVAFSAAASAPTPLFRLYQAEWGFSAAFLTVVFAVYALCVLIALLTTGSLSDHLGRRPVILGAIAAQIVAMTLYLTADSPTALILARAVHGLATGAATGAMVAATVDIDRERGSLINALAPLSGLALGALVSGGLAMLSAAPLRTIFLVAIGVFALAALLVRLMPETAPRRPGALRSLRPRLAVPARSRSTLLRVSPMNVAVWALGGFFLSLMPSLIQAAAGIESPLIGAVAVTLLSAAGTVVVPAARLRPTGMVLRLSAVALALGVIVILIGVHTGLVALILAGALIAGTGWGGGFLGCVRSVIPLAQPGERAGLTATLYTQSYLAFSLPAMAAGAASRHIGLIAATDLYGAALVLLALGAALAVRREAV